MLPRIGITTSFEGGQQALDRRYVQAVTAAGGIPLILPLLESAAAASTSAALLDGLIMTGGPGISRGLLGALPRDLPPVDPLRDRSDALIYRAMADRPFLGICYGMQFANAMAGGTIYGDAQAQLACAPHSRERGASAHRIDIAAGSRLRAIFQTARLRTNSHHIQAVAALGAGLMVSARAADGVIEALESADGRVIGLQFHPERMLPQTLPVFEAFVRRAATTG